MTDHNAPLRKDEIQGDVIHEYDGIEEADNDLPQWWLGLFYACTLFAVGYWFYYHVYNVGPLTMEAYAKELADSVGEGGEVSEELLLALMEDPDAIAEGSALFVANCVVCHNAKGEGNIGPNLTDPYWIHGGSPVDIHRVIDQGVLSAGMPAWGSLLGPEKARQVTAYALTLRGTNIPGKQPQGELWSPDNGAEPGTP